MQTTNSFDRRALALGVTGLAVALVAMLLVRDRVGAAAGGLAAADPIWLWLGAACIAGVIGSTAAAWRVGLLACGGHGTPGACAARYAVGSFVNVIAPQGVGGAVRIGLFSRLLPQRGGILEAAGIATAIGAARSPGLAVLVLAAAALGAFPVWPVLLLAAALAAAVAAGLIAQRFQPRAVVARVLDAFRALASQPRRAVVLVGWVTSATACRLAAAAAVAAAIGLDRPLVAAVVMIPAVSLGSAVPMPANLGASGAVVVALGLAGFGVGNALAVAVAFQAIETAVSIGAGLVGVATLSRLRVPAWSLRLAGGAAAVAVVGAFGMTVLG